MVKIVLSMGGNVLREIALAKERIRIGRGPHNDIVIDDGAISFEHAVIVTADDDSFLEDLNSTNGTQVNGQPVRKHFLRDGDVVQLAGYRVLYMATTEKKQGWANRGITEILPRSESSVKGAALIRVLSGAGIGKEIKLTKALMTIGHSPMQVAVIARRSGGYYLTNIEGRADMSVNGQPLGRNPQPLADNDLIDLSGTQMRFLLQEKIPGQA